MVCREGDSVLNEIDGGSLGFSLIVCEDAELDRARQGDCHFKARHFGSSLHLGLLPDRAAR
jgi:hypothetical protein